MAEMEEKKEKIVSNKRANQFFCARGGTKTLTWDLHEARVLLGAAAAARRRPVAGEHPVPSALACLRRQILPRPARPDWSAKRAAARLRRLPRGLVVAPVGGEGEEQGGGNGGGEGATAAARGSVRGRCGASWGGGAKEILRQVPRQPFYM